MSSTLAEVEEATDSMWLTTGGSPVTVSSTRWTTVGSLLYPADHVRRQGVKPSKVWFAAKAGDSSIGLELVLEDQSGRALAGPATTYGSMGMQISVLTPLRASLFRKSGAPQVLILRARHRKAGSPPSEVGQLAIECKK